MVKLNNEGLTVPVNFEELRKKLPTIPNTAARVGKYATDMGLKKNTEESHDEFEFREEDSEDEMTLHDASNIQNLTVDDEKTTVFDLVHRGR
jgi:hypothetical protein